MKSLEKKLLEEKGTQSQHDDRHANRKSAVAHEHHDDNNNHDHNHNHNHSHNNDTPNSVKLFILLNLSMRFYIIFINAVGVDEYKTTYKNDIAKFIWNNFVLIGCCANAYLTYNEAANHYSPISQSGWRGNITKLLISAVIAIPYGFFGFQLFSQANIYLKILSSMLCSLCALPVPFFIIGTHFYELISGATDEEIKKCIGTNKDADIQSKNLLLLLGIVSMIAVIPDEYTVSMCLPFTFTIRLILSSIFSSVEIIPHLNHWRFYKTAFSIFKKFKLKDQILVGLAAFGHGADGFSNVNTLKNYWSWGILAAIWEMVLVLMEAIFHRHQHQHQITHDPETAVPTLSP